MLTKMELYNAVKVLERHKPLGWPEVRQANDDKRTFEDLQALLMDLSRMDKLSLEALEEHLKDPVGRFVVLEDIERE